MTRAPKPRRISREEAINVLDWLAQSRHADEMERAVYRMAIRALKREQKAADAKKKETKR